MAELNGYIKLYRKLVTWGWYQDVVVKSLFLHCLLLASFRDFNWMDKRLSAGQFVTSYKKLAEDLGFSVQQIRTALKKLESTGELTSKSTNKFSIITVMNWENYQIDIEESNTQSNNPITNEQQTNNKQITNNQQHIKNIKNNKNYKNYKNIYSSSSSLFTCARENLSQDEKFAIEEIQKFPKENQDMFLKCVAELVNKYFDRESNISDIAIMYCWIMELKNKPQLNEDELNLLREAFLIAYKANAVTMAYINGIFVNWSEEGINSYFGYIRHEATRNI